MKKAKWVSVFVVGVVWVSGAWAGTTSFVGKLVVVEPTYMPSSVTFQLYAGNATCPPGTWLVWKNASADNVKSVYSGLLAALMAGRDVRFYMNEGDSTCTGTFVHVLGY